MRIITIVAAAFLWVPSIAASQDQRGALTGITATAGPIPGNYRFTVSGTNPCGAVHVDFGDGSSHTYDIERLPDSATIWHHYTRDGRFNVRAAGVRNCGGEAVTAVTVTLPPPPPTPTPTPVPTPAAAPPIRFAEMDTNNDQVITRAEWRGSARSFAVHDWNNDGRLSGDEVRLGAVPPVQRGAARGDAIQWTEARFRALDANRDGRLTRNEWPHDLEAFMRVDRNGDAVITLNEFLVSEIDDDREDRFDDLDVNRDNRITRNEWHGSLETFRWLDRNGDGVLSRAEVVGTDAAGPPAGRIVVPSRSITINARTAWTDTGIDVRAGDAITVTASGEIQVTPNARDLAGPNGAAGKPATARAPRPDVDIGALLGRVGNGEPFFVGANAQSLRVEQSGRLYFGPNDDVVTDNRGQFRVVFSVAR